MKSDDEYTDRRAELTVPTEQCDDLEPHPPHSWEVEPSDQDDDLGRWCEGVPYGD